MHEFKLSEHFMGAATVGERGQVVIPAEARERQGISAGDKLLVFSHPAGWGVLFVKLEKLQEVQDEMGRVLSELHEYASDEEQAGQDGAST